MKIQNNIKQFIEKNDLNLYGLLNLLAVKHKQQIDEYFPVNCLSSVYYLVAYTYFGEDLAMQVLKNIRTAFKFVDDLDERIEGGALNLSKLLENEDRKILLSNLPTTFIKSVIDRLLTQSAPMLVNFTQMYARSLKDQRKFYLEEIEYYLQTKAADSYLYVAFLESLFSDFNYQIQKFFLSNTTNK